MILNDTIRAANQIWIISQRGGGGRVVRIGENWSLRIYDVSARYGCYAFHRDLYLVWCWNRVPDWMILGCCCIWTSSSTSPDSLVFQIFFPSFREILSTVENRIFFWNNSEKKWSINFVNEYFELYEWTKFVFSNCLLINLDIILLQKIIPCFIKESKYRCIILNIY